MPVMRNCRFAPLIALTCLALQAPASESGGAGLQVQAKSALIIDEKSGCVLFSKEANAKRFPASCTKILTTLILLEKTLPTDKIVAPWDIETIPESSLHLKPGEVMTAEELAYAMMLRSANDACCAVAVHISGSVPAFAAELNKRAKEIGCTSTNFVTPNGLHDPNHYTTASDLAKIAREAMKNPAFRKIVDTPKRQTVRSINQEDLWLISKNKFLTWDPTHDGIKTGYTRPAGSCFVGSATRNGFRVITVILASEDWKADEKAMMDWAFKNFERQIAFAKDTRVGEAPIKEGVLATVPLKIAEPVYYALKKGSKPDIKQELKLKSDLVAPVEAGAKVGTVVFKDGNGWVQELPVFAVDAVEKQPPLAARVASWPFLIIGGVLVGGTLVLKKRQSKFYKSAAGRRRA
ncbi:MAG: D-alanyl-D-alanine carboxypeptidase [Fimbriimonadaceae bacterium]|nr:D-alanyl-D-alanine carboxypeptidase [Fimbriimonadaceae bacterium]